MGKFLFTTLFIVLASVGFSQTNKSALVGYWKFTRMTFSNNFTVDVDSLNAFKQNFLETKRTEASIGKLSKADSASLDASFEVVASKIKKMFLKLTATGNYATNGYKEGSLLSGKTEKGTYTYNGHTQILSLFADNNKSNKEEFKVLQVTKNTLIITFPNQEDNIMVCKKVP